jgi:hypothetical protein
VFPGGLVFSKKRAFLYTRTLIAAGMPQFEISAGSVVCTREDGCFRDCGRHFGIE